LQMITYRFTALHIKFENTLAAQLLSQAVAKFSLPGFTNQPCLGLRVLGVHQHEAVLRKNPVHPT